MLNPIAAICATNATATIGLLSLVCAAAVTYGQAFQGKKVYGAMYGPWIAVSDPVGLGDTPMKLLPSEYFKRQCLISAEPDESITAAVAQHLGEDYVIWASDYPHLDASFNVVGQIREKIAGLPESAQRKILGENAIRFYGLSV